MILQAAERIANIRFDQIQITWIVVSILAIEP